MFKDVYSVFKCQFVLTEMYYDGFHRSFCDDDDDLDIIQESDSIFAFETPETFKLENIRTKRGETLVNSIPVVSHASRGSKPTVLACPVCRESSGKPESQQLKIRG